MNIGIRTHRSASLRIAVAEGLPEEMRPMTREILSVQSTNHRKGHATALMHTVCAEADEWWITLMVQVKRFDDGMNDDQLQRFYSRFDFAKIQDDPVIMVRSPQLSVIHRLH